MNKMTKTLFNYDLSKLSSYVDKEHLRLMELDFIQQIKTQTRTLSETEGFILFLFNHIEEKIKEADRHLSLKKELRKQLSHCASDTEKNDIILEFCYKLKPSKKELQKDELALSRWFDEDALMERISSKISYLHRRIYICLDRIKSSFKILENEDNLGMQQWQSFDLNRHFLNLLQYKEEDLIRDETFTVLIDIVHRISLGEDLSFLDEKIFRFIYKVALSANENVWIQNGAIEFLHETQMASFISVALIRSKDLSSKDSLFVRHKIAELAVKGSDKNQELQDLIINVIAKDPSAYVRQGLVKQIPCFKTKGLENIKSSLLLYDKEPSVRGLAVLQALENFEDNEAFKDYLQLLWKSFKEEKDSFVLKSILFTFKSLVQNDAEYGVHNIEFIHDLMDKLSEFIQIQEDISLRRYAGMVREFLWICLNQNRYESFKGLRSFIKGVSLKKGKKLPLEFLELGKEELYRSLSVISQDDFSLELHYNLFNQIYIYRSDRFGRRLWRIIYEWMNPSPDKRQAFLHTVARVYEGRQYFPSAILAEQAPTRVPGEPYYLPQEQSWRPYLPLMDHFISSLKQPSLRLHTYEIYSSDGITQIDPPKGFFKRVRAEFILSWNFSKLARLRNWTSSFSEEPSAYIESIKKLGFKVKFNPYNKKDESTTKFFPAGIPFLPEKFQDSIVNYFVSAYENSLSDLILFLILVFSIFFIRHLFISRKINKSRKKIPLSIGGWGTRGKSGTERLKAALFNSLGLRVFSKTTGNEAMFLHSDSFESMREMYLFRPYDKATIWEQADAVILAENLGCDVFLWESMGLTPSYVEILQQQWMKDDIATITNTYPDHEDLQGPAGINIPQVMTKFIPQDSVLIASEEIMYPILQEHAHSVNTKTDQVGWLEAGLLAPDILERFPYEEHPYNISLVLSMAKELGLDEDESLKAMADYIVPDLGVLKAYAPSSINNRTLCFINGMSANERFGALGNWKRMGLDTYDDELSDVFITSVINNRADRVARSRVFASMLVEDIVADCHVLIGTNLSGFDNYLEESWQAYKDKLSLQADEEHSSSEKLMQYAKQFRLIRSEKQLQKRLNLMLEPSVSTDKQAEILASYMDLERLEELLKEDDEVFVFYQKFKLQYDELQRLLVLCAKEKDYHQLDENFKTQLWKWLRQRVVSIKDHEASGNDIIKTIVELTPRGMENKIIGMQNIKGTGLDFAYRFVAWDECFKICEDILSGENDKVRQGLHDLANFDEHGPLTFTLVQESIDIAKTSPASQNETSQIQLELIQHKHTQALKEFSKDNEITVDEGRLIRFFYKVLSVLESFLDAGDAVKRRKKANLIYKELISHRISHKRAALELKEITKRQKGGWFTQGFKKRFH